MWDYRAAAISNWMEWRAYEEKRENTVCWPYWVHELSLAKEPSWDRTDYARRLLRLDERMSDSCCTHSCSKHSWPHLTTGAKLNLKRIAALSDLSTHTTAQVLWLGIGYNAIRHDSTWTKEHWTCRSVLRADLSAAYGSAYSDR